MEPKAQKTRLAILNVLREVQQPVGASRIAQRLSASGVEAQSRTIRFHLLQMDREGLTRFVSRRRGRQITERGIEELTRSNAVEKMGFIAAKMDTLGYRMTLSPKTGCGTIIANVAHIHEGVVALAGQLLAEAFGQNLSMGTRLAVMRAGDRIAGILVPEDHLAIGTVCSVTLNGFLLHQGIPLTSRFGGLLEMRHHQPSRFVELVDYHGTTVDPLEVFIRSGMTRVTEFIRTGSGIIGASFREFPSAALDDVTRLRKGFHEAGLDGVLTIGYPSRPLLGIPVTEGRTGMIVIGGLNPIAALHEAGIRVSLTSLVGLEEYERFIPYQDAVRSRK